VIPEYPFELEHLTELLSYDRRKHPSNYSVVLISEGATMVHHDDMSFEGEETDQYGHKKLGGIGDQVAQGLKELSPSYNGGRRVNVLSQRLGYLVRSGDPDAMDSIVPMAYGNLALDLVIDKSFGRLVGLHNGCYDSVPIEAVTGHQKIVDVKKYYNTERLRPKYESFQRLPLFIMTSDP
jgi:6-phosphofructokinase 1